MANASMKPKAPSKTQGLTVAQEEEIYFRDTNPRLASIDIGHFDVDRICTLCGCWKSEHSWDTCSEPNWL